MLLEQMVCKKQALKGSLDIVHRSNWNNSNVVGYMGRLLNESSYYNVSLKFL
jgi:hypothetical protein